MGTRWAVDSPAHINESSPLSGNGLTRPDARGWAESWVGHTLYPMPGLSTKKQQEAGNLDRQLGRLTAFATEQHQTVVAHVDGRCRWTLNEKRRGQHQLLDLSQQHQAGIVVGFRIGRPIGCVPRPSR